MKRTKLLLLALVVVSVTIFTMPSTRTSASTDAPTPTVEYKSAIISWRYKNINGHAYRRKFNKTTQKWIGDWIRL